MNVYWQHYRDLVTF